MTNEELQKENDQLKLLLLKGRAALQKNMFIMLGTGEVSIAATRFGDNNYGISFEPLNKKMEIGEEMPDHIAKRENCFFIESTSAKSLQVLRDHIDIAIGLFKTKPKDWGEKI